MITGEIKKSEEIGYASCVLFCSVSSIDQYNQQSPNDTPVNPVHIHRIILF